LVQFGERIAIHYDVKFRGITFMSSRWVAQGCGGHSGGWCLGCRGGWGWWYVLQ
jgi:hypothetical protein